MGKVAVKMEIEAPVDQVFSFFAESSNFGKLFPDEANFECEKLTSGPPCLGSQRRIEVNIGGRRIEQVVETVEFVENLRQVDRQVEGEMKKFEKTQLFEATERGTKVTGIIEYEMPYSILGKIMDLLIVRRQMTAYFQGAFDKGKSIFDKNAQFSVPAPEPEKEAA
jgi:ligand-binding SRPBCC domain-containing protein